MKRRALVVFLATAVAAAVIFWPPTPAWRAAVGPGMLLGISPDGGTVFRCEGRYGGSRPIIVGHDAATGPERSRVALAGRPDEAWEWDGVVLSPDATRAVVYRQQAGGTAATPVPAGWVLFDAATGTQLTPHTPVAATRMDPTFAPDGRHFSVGRWAGGTAGIMWTHEVYEAATGRRLFAVAPTAAEHPIVLGYRADGRQAAVVWSPLSGVAAGWRVEVCDLPSGEVVRGFPLPPGGWSWMAEWRGDRFTVIAHVPNAAGGCDLHGLTFDVAADPVGPGANADAWTAADLNRRPVWLPGPRGDGWATETKWRGRGSWCPQTLAAWASRFDLIDYRGIEQRVRFEDPTAGVARVELPVWLDITAAVSPDGRRVADLYKGELRVWSAASAWPREPFAMIVMGAVMLIGRRVTR